MERLAATNDAEVQALFKQHIEDFRNGAKKCAIRIQDFMEKRDTGFSYPKVQPLFLRNVQPAKPPVDPETFKAVFDDFFKIIVKKGTCHWNHPGNLAYFPVGNAFANVYGDMLSTAFGGVGFSWSSQPALTELENVMMDWLAYALHLPDQFIFRRSNKKGGGCTQNSASDAIYSTIISARDSYINQHLKKDDPKDHAGHYLKNIQCYVSSEGHSCVEKGARVAMVSIKKIKANANSQMTGVELEKAITEDIAKKLVPVYCCATLGTPGTCSYDDLSTIGPVCKKHNIWLHVDAAYAGNAWILPEKKELLKGLEFADSIVVNPYKLMLGAADLSCLYFSDTEKFVKPFVIDATYLIKNFDDQIDYRHYGVPLSRRMRSLKLWFLFRCYGLVGLRQYISGTCKAAKLFEQLLSADTRFKIMNTVTLGIVCFRQNLPAGVDPNVETNDFKTALKQIEAYNVVLLRRINKLRQLYLTLATTNEGICLRISVNYEFITSEAIESIVSYIKSSYIEQAYYGSFIANLLKTKAKITKPLDGPTLKTITASVIPETKLEHVENSSSFEPPKRLPKIRNETKKAVAVYDDDDGLVFDVPTVSSRIETSADLIPVYDDDDDLVFDMSVINSNKKN